ncbi:class I adenylate-forming enzyme family protein [Pseudonocardia sp. H11422]|uniref:class I adenylate-forming enzyme family protein n=1 Tax=Pseudonocardia sp. H11422 TaxID=2835866 RepID=UPI0027E39323|nr:AMP-binding protein [Pseudonocardia sp. H11422]
MTPAQHTGTDPVDERSRSGWARHLGVDVAHLATARLRDQLTAGTLPAAFSASAANRPEATLRIAGESITHGELAERVARSAAAFAAIGVRARGRVLLCAHPALDWVVAYLGLLHCGAVVVLANPAYTARELDHLLSASSARTAVVNAAAQRTLAGRVALVELTSVARAAGSSAPCPATIDPDDPALIAFTSGTSGAPKAVPLSHAMLLSSIRGVMQAWRWQRTDVLVHTLPLFHQHGLGGLHATLLAGSHAVLLPRLDPAELVRTIAAERATVLFGVPALYERLLALEPDLLAPLRGLRLLTSGSAPLAPRLARRVGAVLGQLPLERYGLTETGLDLSNPYDGPRVPGTVGIPLPGVEVRVITPAGDPCPAGTDGEIVMRGPQVFRGYLDDEPATTASFSDGWFRTGDLGRWDRESGHLVISGRLKEIIITGGLNVAPREVELVLEEIPAVREAAVAGLPDERWGEQVTAWVVPQPGGDLDLEALHAHCRSRLAAFKCPKQVRVVSSLPRNALGKVVRGELGALQTAREDRG